MDKAKQFGPRYAIANFTVLVRGEHGCSIMSNAASAKEQADCYLSSRPGGVVDVEYSETCGYCRGHGSLNSRRSGSKRSLKPCPHCDGKGELAPDMRVASYVGSSWSPLAETV